MTNVKIIPFKDQKTEALIFDLGGVLLNLDFNKSLDAFIKLGFKNVEHEMFRLLRSQPAGDDESVFHLYEKGEISSGQFRDELRKFAKKDIKDEDIDRAWTAMLLDLHESNIRLLIKLQKSFRLFLLSNTNAIHIETLHNRNQNGKSYSSLVGLFEKVYYSHEVGMRKPDSEIFDHVIDDSGLIADSSLFIDDSIHNVEGARSVGLKAYHHTAGASLDKVFNIG